VKRGSLRWVQYGGHEVVQALLRRVSRTARTALAKPASVSIGITHRCNCRCVHCDIWKLPPTEEVGLQDWRNIIADLGAWLGGGRLHFSGGEPLMRQDLVELVRAASRQGFLVGVVTNGMLLTRPAAEKLLAAGLFSLDVSLDSLEPAAHDGIRGVAGSCTRALRAVETMISLGAGSRTSIACVLTSANIDHVEPLIRWVQDRGLRGLSLQVLEENFEGSSRIGWHEDHPLWIRDVAAVDRLSRRLLALRASGARILNHPAQLKLLARYYEHPERLRDIPCLVGYFNLGIGPRGDVRLCHRLPTIGNVLDGSARAIWRSETANARRRQVAACTRGCRILNCNFPSGPLTRARRLIAIRKAGHVS
jgi:MoaA/NifB/PqqE/SkfB family radical SAM enzyme